MNGRSIDRGQASQAVAAAGLAAGVALLSTSPEAAAQKKPLPKIPEKKEAKESIPGEIPLSEVPASIKESAHHVLKTAKWDSAAKHKHEGETVYELFGTDDKGRDLSVEITDGKVTSIERGIEPKDIAKAASDAVAKHMPAFKIEHALEIFEGDDIRDLAKADHSYQLNGTGAKGKDLTVEVTTEGKILEVKREIEMAEVNKTVSEVLTKKVPKFQVETVHRVVRDEKVAGYLFASKRGWIVYISNDGAEFEMHKAE